ncbi:hypothetical protein ABK040_007498 [Willaertia magna]
MKKSFDIFRKKTTFNKNKSNNEKTNVDNSNNPLAKLQRGGTIVKIKHKGTINITLKIEQESSSLSTSSTEELIEVVCSSSENILNFLKDKIPLLKDDVIKFKEKYGIFFVRDESVNRLENEYISIHSKRGDWLMNLNVTFNDLKVDEKCIMECVLLKKKVNIQFGEQFCKPIELNELQTVQELTNDICKHFTIKKEFIEDFSLKFKQQFLINNLTLREQGIILIKNLVEKLKIIKKYHFTTNLLLKELKLNTLALSLTYFETKDRFLNGTLFYSLDSQFDILIKLISLIIYSESKEKEFKQLMSENQSNQIIELLNEYFPINLILNNNQILFEKLKKEILNNKNYKSYNIVDAQTEFVMECSNHPFFKFNLFEVKCFIQNNNQMSNVNNEEVEQSSVDNNEELFKDYLFGIDDLGISIIHLKDKYIINSIPFKNINNQSFELKIIVKQPEPIIETIITIHSNQVYEIENLLQGIITHFIKNDHLNDDDENVSNQNVEYKNEILTIEECLKNKEIVKEAYLELENLDKYMNYNNGPIQLYLKNKELEWIHYNYHSLFENEENDEMMTSDSINYNEIKTLEELREISLQELIEIEMERKSKELQLKLLENLNNLNLMDFTIDKIYAKKVLEMKQESDLYFNEIDNYFKNNNDNLLLQKNLQKLQQIFINQINYLFQYEKYLNDHFLNLKELQKQFIENNENKINSPKVGITSNNSPLSFKQSSPTSNNNNNSTMNSNKKLMLGNIRNNSNSSSPSTSPTTTLAYSSNRKISNSEELLMTALNNNISLIENNNERNSLDNDNNNSNEKVNNNSSEEKVEEDNNQDQNNNNSTTNESKSATISELTNALKNFNNNNNENINSLPPVSAIDETNDIKSETTTNTITTAVDNNEEVSTPPITGNIENESVSSLNDEDKTIATTTVSSVDQQNISSAPPTINTNNNNSSTPISSRFSEIRNRFAQQQQQENNSPINRTASSPSVFIKKKDSKDIFTASTSCGNNNSTPSSPVQQQQQNESNSVVKNRISVAHSIFEKRKQFEKQ